MAKFPRLLTLFAFAVFAAVQPALADEASVNAAIDTVLGDHAQYQSVIEAFQQAVADGDAAGAAALVAYPITVKVNGKRTSISDEEAFVQDYDAIMTPNIVDAISNQDYGSLFVRDQGVMFGNGQAWLNGICRDNACDKFDVKVITIQEAN
ncbi:MAG: hypothetical protein JWN11_1468 [Hyphomicrobiales bacterium]|nr:hypothetical protein [Hyphomicrobiales bacterium]